MYTAFSAQLSKHPLRSKRRLWTNKMVSSVATQIPILKYDTPAKYPQHNYTTGYGFSNIEKVYGRDSMYRILYTLISHYLLIIYGIKQAIPLLAYNIRYKAGNDIYF